MSKKKKLVCHIPTQPSVMHGHGTYKPESLLSLLKYGSNKMPISEGSPNRTSTKKCGRYTCYMGAKGVGWP